MVDDGIAPFEGVFQSLNEPIEFVQSINVIDSDFRRRAQGAEPQRHWHMCRDGLTKFEIDAKAACDCLLDNIFCVSGAGCC